MFLASSRDAVDEDGMTEEARPRRRSVFVKSAAHPDPLSRVRTRRAGTVPARRPTVVLVHGAFVDASGWNDVIARLNHAGYPVVAPANPLCGVAADSAYLAGILATLGGPLVLAAHSYGGNVITNAATGNANVEGHRPHLSAWNTSDTASMLLDGTSMATPFATGIAALIWSMHPSHTAAEITADVSHVATHGVIPGYTAGPNRHVFVPTIIISGLREISGFGGLSVTNSVAAAGGAAPCTWSATGLPPAITINPSTGMLSGRLSLGTYTVTVTATDAAGRATATWYADRLCLASADVSARC